MCAAFNVAVRLSSNHSLKLVSRRGRYLTAPSGQDIIYVAQKVYNMTTPLHNTQELNALQMSPDDCTVEQQYAEELSSHHTVAIVT